MWRVHFETNESFVTVRLFYDICWWKLNALYSIDIAEENSFVVHGSCVFTNRCELAYDRGIRHIDACSRIYGLPVFGLFIC